MVDENFLELAFQSEDIKSLFGNLDFMSCNGIPIKMCLFLMEEGSIQLIKNEEPKNVKRDIEILNEKEGIFRISFKLLNGSGDEQISKGIIFRYPGTEKIFFYVSFSKSNIFEKIIKNYFNKFYPKVSRIFLTSNNLYKMIECIKEKYDKEVFISKMVVKRKDREQIDVEYKKEKVSYKKAFEEAKLENKIIKSVNISTDDLDAYISRLAIFRLNKGSFSTFSEDLLKQVLHFVDDEEKLLSNREQSEETNYKAKPLIINFSYNIFESVTNLREFKDELTKMKNISYNIIHFNPYLQMSITDTRDGSTFNIWVLSKDSILIFPQFRSTFASLSKFISAIFERFSEGKISEFKYE